MTAPLITPRVTFGPPRGRRAAALGDTAAADRAARRRRVLIAAVAFCWLALAAAVYLAPALTHGKSLGPYDILGRIGITEHTATAVHNPVGSDEIEEFIPWEALSWMEVHAGHLPLWNPYSLLGLPLAFNLQSAPFSAAVAIGYLFPLGLAHTVTIVARLLIAGGGVLVLCRTSRLRMLSALFTATIFELSGGLTIWLGSYEAGCLGWMGWVLAASVLVLRGQHRARDVTLLAVAVASLLYAGEPQIALLALGWVAVFVGVMTLPLLRTSRRRALRVLVDHLIGVAAGIALAAPVYLPGVQLALRSVRSTGPPVTGLPLYDLTHLIFGGYNGLPTNVDQVIAPDNLYVSMIYVGVIGVVLACVALTLARRRIEVVAFAVLTGCLLVLLFASPVVSLLSHLAYLRVFRILLATTLVDFAIAMLAGLGREALLSAGREGRPVADRALAVTVWATAAVLLVLGIRLALNVDHLSSGALSTRAESFIWPSAELLALAAVVVFRGRRRPDRRRAADHRALVGLLVIETAFLVSTGSGLLSSNASGLPVTRSAAALQHAVGASLVGIGTCGTNSLAGVGLVPNTNVAYGVDELATLDPIFPTTYYGAYDATTKSSTPPSLSPSLFCPAISSVALARELGVSYVLEPAGTPGPPGTTRVTELHGEGLFKVPVSGRATLVPLSKGVSRATTVAHATQPSPTSWRVVIDPSSPSKLRLRITDVPGWDATIDGRPLALRPFDHVMLQATVPAGRSVIALVYRPLGDTVGLLLAAGAALSLVAAMAISRTLRRRRRLAVVPRPAGTRRGLPGRVAPDPLGAVPGVG